MLGGLLLLMSQAGSSVLTFIPVAFAVVTLTDTEIATVAIAITTYSMCVGIGRSAFGEAVLVLAAERGAEWADRVIAQIRTLLMTASLALAGLGLALRAIDVTLETWPLVLSASLAVMSHDARRYQLISHRRDRLVVGLDVGLVLAMVTCFGVASRVEQTLDLYLLAWVGITVLWSADLLVQGWPPRSFAIVEVLRTGWSFATDVFANRAAILVVTLIAREATGDSSLANAESLRLTMAAVNIVFLGAGPIALRHAGRSTEVFRPGLAISGALIGVATAWWAVLGFTGRTFDFGGAILDAWRGDVEWAVLIWFIGAAMPFGFRYRMRAALSTTPLLRAATAEAVLGTLVVLIGAAAGWIDDATHVFAVHFTVGALAWIVVAALSERRPETVQAATRTGDAP